MRHEFLSDSMCVQTFSFFKLDCKFARHVFVRHVFDTKFLTMLFRVLLIHFCSSPINLVKKSSENWSNVLIGMFLVIIVNSLVVIGIVFNIHLLLIPWQFIYILGKSNDTLYYISCASTLQFEYQCYS